MKIKHKGNYAERRAAEYPGLTEQLDMLWHAMDKGEMPKSEPFYSSLKDVKERFPKESYKPV